MSLSQQSKPLTMYKLDFWSRTKLMFILIGFLDKEIEKADIHVTDTGENPEAPQLREMIDLEVGINFILQSHLY